MWERFALPNMREAKKRVAEKRRQYGRDQMDWQSNSHELIEVVNVGWKTWHGISVQKRLGAGGCTLLTCKKCLMVKEARNKFNRCRDNHKVTTAQMTF